MMKTLSRKQILYYSAFALLAGLILACVRIAVTAKFLDRGIELYAHGTVADDILHIAIIVCVAVICSVFLLPLTAEHDGTFRRASPLTVFSATFSGFMLLAYDIILIYETAADEWHAFDPLRELAKQLATGQVPETQTVPSGPTVAGAIFLACLMFSALPAAIWFFKVASTGASEKPSFAVFASFPVIWNILLTLHMYFDTTTALNSPLKVLRIFSLLMFFFYAAQETRCILGIPMPRCYFAFACISVLLGTVVTVSDAILYAKDVIVLRNGYLIIAMQLSYIIYIVSRCLMLGTQTVPKSTE